VHERVGGEARIAARVLDLDRARLVQRAQAEALLRRDDGGLGADARADELALAGDEGDHRDAGTGDGRGDPAHAIQRRIGRGGQQAQLSEQVEAARVVVGSCGVHPSGRSCRARIAPMAGPRERGCHPGRGGREPVRGARASTGGHRLST